MTLSCWKTRPRPFTTRQSHNNSGAGFSLRAFLSLFPVCFKNKKQPEEYPRAVLCASAIQFGDIIVHIFQRPAIRDRIASANAGVVIKISYDKSILAGIRGNSAIQPQAESVQNPSGFAHFLILIIHCLYLLYDVFQHFPCLAAPSRVLPCLAMPAIPRHALTNSSVSPLFYSFAHRLSRSTSNNRRKRRKQRRKE